MIPQTPALQAIFSQFLHPEQLGHSVGCAARDAFRLADGRIAVETKDLDTPLYGPVLDACIVALIHLPSHHHRDRTFLAETIRNAIMQILVALGKRHAGTEPGGEGWSQFDQDALNAALGAPTVAAMYTGTSAARDVLAERNRQLVRGRTPEDDDQWVCDELAALACVYAMPPAARDWDATSTGYGDTLGDAILPPNWVFNPGNRRDDLKKAGALIQAEIERIDRAQLIGGV